MDCLKHTLASAALQTPAFVYDEHVLSGILSRQVSRLEALGCDVLFAVKSFAVPDCLAYMAPSLAGFAVSSANEARLAREVLGHDGEVHFTSPAVSTSDAEPLAGFHQRRPNVQPLRGRHVDFITQLADETDAHDNRRHTGDHTFAHAQIRERVGR